MTRPSVAVGVLALVLLAVGVLTVTFVELVAGQSASAEEPTPAEPTPAEEPAPTEATATATATAPSACSEYISAAELDKPLTVGTCISAEEMESRMEWAATSIGATGCEKNSGNPHIATSTFPDSVKTVGGVIRCKSKKDYLYSNPRLWKKDNGTWVLKDASNGYCNNCYKKMMPAQRRCWNRNDNQFVADVYVVVRNNGNRTDGRGESQTVTVNCGGF